MERPPLTTTVEGLPLSLTERDDGHWDMRNRVSSVSAPVTSYEARCLINAGKFAALGDPVESRGTSGPNAGLPTQAAYRDQLACWIDSTTLMASTSAVRRERTPAPGALFDLATLCFAVMCYDKILVDGQQVKVPDQLSNVIVPIDIRSGAGPNPGYTYASQVNDFAGRIRPDSFAELGVAWSEFLERPVELSFDAVDRATDSPGRWPYLPGDVFGVGWELPRKGSGGSLNTDASIQTWRYFINEHFASKHGVPYHCTSLRYPVANYALGWQRVYRATADDLLNKTLGQPPQGLAAIPSRGYLPELRLPHALSVVVRRATDRTEIWAALRDLHEEFAPVRKWLLEAKQSGAGEAEITDLVRRVNGRKNAGATMDAITVTGASVVAAAAPGAGTLAVTLLKVAASIRPFEKAGEMLLRMRRPEIYALRSFRRESMHLEASTRNIDRLWPPSTDDNELTFGQPTTPSSAGKRQQDYGFDGVNREWLQAARRLNEVIDVDATRLRDQVIIP